MGIQLIENRFTEDVGEAADILKAGGLVAYPTESFYGIAAEATNEKAILRLFRVKKRKGGQPVLLLIPDIGSLNRYAVHIPKTAERLMEVFWPGGLTLVFWAQKSVSTLLTAGTGKIGLRLSSHKIAKALAKRVGSAITGTSANISGELPCTTPHEVLNALGKGVDKVLDGGHTPGDKPSTVLDVTTQPFTLLREGIISKKVLQSHCSKWIE